MDVVNHRYIYPSIPMVNLFLMGIAYASPDNCMHVQLLEVRVGKKQNQTQREPQALTGLDRLGLRVSAMIASPVAQIQRWVTIHKLDTDDDQAWDEIVAVLSETDGIEMIFNDDGAITLRWDAQTDNDQLIAEWEVEPVLDKAPF
ncbi:DUF1654 domain-containing protein [Pseudomonas sp. NPDC096950]|uniref:DUF1654 domain-containing protein n=1 Tax=Pseudomonas sp. NPDC096950 TaxID=3364485 RepID=UPI00383BDA79